MKMFQFETTSEFAGHPIRQSFVTQSRTLVERVETYYRSLLSTASGHKHGSSAEPTPTLDMSLRRMDQRLVVDKFPAGTKFSDLQDHHFPLFLTFGEVRHLLPGELRH